MALVVELTSLIIPSDQTKEERQYVLVVTALVRRLNLEATSVILRDMVTALAREVTFWNPWMPAVPAWTQWREKGNCQCHCEATGRERCRVKRTLLTSQKKKGTITTSRWNEYHVC